MGLFYMMFVYFSFFKQHFCNISWGAEPPPKKTHYLHGSLHGSFKMQTGNHKFRENVATDKKYILRP